MRMDILSQNGCAGLFSAGVSIVLDRRRHCEEAEGRRSNPGRHALPWIASLRSQ
jgi:hypothetical protein